MSGMSANQDDIGQLNPTAGARESAGLWERRLRVFRAEHTERSREIGGQAWPYLAGGQGKRAALLLHGSASDGESLFGLMAPLERSYRVVAPTYPDGAGTVTGVVDGLAGLLDSLGMAPALVIGYSLGGYLAQALAWRHPERVAGLALLNTGGPAREAAWPAAMQNALLATLPSPLLGVAARVVAGAHLRLEAPGLDAGAAAFWREYMSEMARRVGKRRVLTHGRLVVDFLRGPVGLAAPAPATLIVNSARDRTIEPAERRALDRLYPLAARLMEPNAGHLSVPAQPERYLAAIEEVFPLPRANR